MTSFASTFLDISDVELSFVISLKKAELRQSEPTLSGVFAYAEIVILLDSSHAKNVGL